MEKSNIEKKDESIEILEFKLKNDHSIEKYGVEVAHVNEVYAAKSATFLPCTPSFIIGIVNCRGKIISVIDIRNFLGFTMKKIDIHAVKKIMVVKVEEIEVGIAIDDLLGCKEIALGEIQQNALMLTNSNKSYFKGITKERSIILDIKNILKDEKIVVDEEVT